MKQITTFVLSVLIIMIPLHQYLFAQSSTLTKKELLKIPEFTSGFEDGKVAADSCYSAIWWGVGGACSWFLIVGAGPIVITVASQTVPAKPKFEPSNVDYELYKKGFYSGYQKRVKQKRLIGILTGTVAFSAAVGVTLLYSHYTEGWP